MRKFLLSIAGLFFSHICFADVPSDYEFTTDSGEKFTIAGDLTYFTGTDRFIINGIKRSNSEEPERPLFASSETMNVISQSICQDLSRFEVYYLGWGTLPVDGEVVGYSLSFSNSSKTVEEMRAIDTPYFVAQNHVINQVVVWCSENP